MEMLRLNVDHHGHVTGAVHPAMMLVKNSRTDPNSARSGNAQAPPKRLSICISRVASQESQESVESLQVFRIVSETVRPALGTKRPELRVAEDEQEKTGK